MVVYERPMNRKYGPGAVRSKPPKVMETQIVGRCQPKPFIGAIYIYYYDICTYDMWTLCGSIAQILKNALFIFSCSNDFCGYFWTSLRVRSPVWAHLLPMWFGPVDTHHHGYGCSQGLYEIIPKLLQGVADGWIFWRYLESYPLVNQHNYGKSPFLMGNLTINGHFQ